MPFIITFCFFIINLILLGIQIFAMKKKKEERMVVRVSVQEKEGFERAAEIAGIGFSAWARQKLRSAAIKDLEDVGEKIPFLTPINIKNSNG